jgi:hypothetical protein
MNNLVEQMIQTVESNAVDNKAVIPNVEAWAIAWREEAAKRRTTPWLEIWSQYIKSDSKFGVVNLFDFLTENYEPPVKI